MVARTSAESRGGVTYSLGLMDAMKPSISPEVVDELLFDLCVVLGLCIPPDKRASFIDNPPTDIEGFIDAIKTAGGGDARHRPHLHQATRQIIARHLGIEEPQTLDLPTAKEIIEKLRKKLQN
jgi:hypothetical protein